jgi:hypothetical protein
MMLLLVGYALILWFSEQAGNYLASAFDRLTGFWDRMEYPTGPCINHIQPSQLRSARSN